MRRTVGALALLLALPGALAAQAVITVPPQQCVWRAGDNAAWAAPNLDESGWQPYTAWQPSRRKTQLWVRCHTDLGPLQNDAQPAVQVSMFGAYELYLNGRRLGSAGSVRSGNFSMNSIRSYAIPPLPVPLGPSLLALHITRRDALTHSQLIRSLALSKMDIRVGDESLLDGLRARTVLAGEARFEESALCYLVISVIAILLFGLFLSDRSRRELLLLCATCLGVVTLRLSEFCVASLLNYSLEVSLAIILVANVILTLAQVPFAYALAHRRVPWVVRILLAVTALDYAPGLLGLVSFAHQPAWIGWVDDIFFRQSGIALHMGLCVAQFLAFWPFKSLAPRMRPLAVLNMLWAGADLVWFALEATAFPIPGVPNLFAHWGITLLEVRAILIAAVLAALLGLLFRDHRQATQERAMLAGEMRAARAVQQVIIPDAIPSVPGFAIESAYKPAGEVGGDFFQILPTAAGGVLIVIGDVSGKGMPAALTVSLLVGTVRTLAHYTQSPGAILAAMNQRMLGRSQGGFTTCLVVRADENGKLTIANAGHLAPYRNTLELPLENGLPLGLDAHAVYAEAQFQAQPGERITLLSDGVVEARNAQGELFGFERAAKLSTEPAEKVAQAAQAFGQEDDITVLTLSFASAGVVHA